MLIHQKYKKYKIEAVKLGLRDAYLISVESVFILEQNTQVSPAERYIKKINQKNKGIKF